jgi:hypothetical protein
VHQKWISVTIKKIETDPLPDFKGMQSIWQAGSRFGGTHRFCQLPGVAAIDENICSRREALGNSPPASMSNKTDQQQAQHQSAYTAGKTTTGERREARRYAFICTAEFMSVAGGMPISARTSDLSLTGCYIDTLNPFPVGTRILLQLTKNNQRLQFHAEVTSSHRSSGMGVSFDSLTPAQVEIVGSWLEETSAPAEHSFRSQPSAAVPETSPEKSADAPARFATRLVQMLERKGIVTRSEAKELLRDFNS